MDDQRVEFRFVGHPDQTPEERRAVHRRVTKVAQALQKLMDDPNAFLAVRFSALMVIGDGRMAQVGTETEVSPGCLDMLVKIQGMSKQPLVAKIDLRGSN